jgi:CspA family cold shock protein
MANGIVKSFNRSRGYGFIQMDSGGKDIFVHLSAVQEAGLADLRKGQRITFEIFDNQGKAAAKNLRVDGTVKDASEHALVSVQNEVTQNARYEMRRSTERPPRKRTSITRAALESAIVETVRQSDPQCKALVGIIVERVIPASPDGANWAVKGVKYGKAERVRCSAAISNCVVEGQGEFEVSDWSK